MMQRMANERIVREYQITSQTNGAPSSAIQLNYPITTGLQRLILKARGDNVVFKFGSDNTVAASNTLTSSKLPDGNFSVEQAMAMSLDQDCASQQWVSVINEAQSTGVTAIIQVCEVIF